MLFCGLVCVALFSTAPGYASSQIYTYIDDSGTQTFTTDPWSAPEQYQDRIVPLDLGSSSAAAPSQHTPPSPNTRVVDASGEYRMGDHDTRHDAVRLAVDAAKRDALEQVATYLESVTEVKNLDVTRDEIRTYTAGIVSVLDQRITTRLEGETVVIRADLTAQVDPEEVTRAITALRENESAKGELVALRAETDQLRQQLEAANRALADAVSPDEIQAMNQQRQDLLDHVQANNLVSQAWTDWVYAGPVGYPYPSMGVQRVYGLLLQAQHFYPRSHHIPIAQNIVTAQSGSLQPPPPGAPQTAPTRPSLLVPPPSSINTRGPLVLLPGSANAQVHADSLRGPAAVPRQNLLPGSANAAVHADALRSAAAVSGQQPTTWPRVPHISPPQATQSGSQTARMPSVVPHHAPVLPRQFGGGGHFGGAHGSGGHGGGGRHGR
ncbi:MAG TPA: hypothetical protein VFS39_13590 [Nitrospira sp.]|nr:hypothetical protein [Nitrospira sp.]